MPFVTGLSSPARSFDSERMLGDVDGASAAYTDYLLAVAHHRVGDSAAAQAALEQADAAAEWELVDEEHPAAWNRRLTLKLLRNQADSLIYESSGVTGEEGGTQKTQD